MFIDFLFFILLLLAVFKGFSRGLIVAVFSLVAFFVGLLAAVKFSASVAVWLRETSGSQSVWIPFIAFVLVMALVMLLIRIGANMIDKVLQVAMLGWLNKLGGVLFYSVMYMAFFSIVLFYAEHLGLLSDDTIRNSQTYGFIAPLAPAVIDALGSVMPFFKGLFQQLESFFDNPGNRGT